MPENFFDANIRDHQREGDASANLLQSRSAAPGGSLQAAGCRRTTPRVALRFNVVGWSRPFSPASILRRSQPVSGAGAFKKNSGGGDFSTAGADFSNV